MDLSIVLENHKLNIRAAGVIIHNNKILVHKNEKEGHYALLGGRVMAGESSEETIKREIFEELGKEVEVNGYISTIENFFNANGYRYHEIMFVYALEFTNDEDKLIEHSLKNIENKDYLKYEWIELDKLDEYNLLPIVVKEVLKKGKFPVHKINVDL